MLPYKRQWSLLSASQRKAGSPNAVKKSPHGFSTEWGNSQRGGLWRAVSYFALGVFPTDKINGFPRRCFNSEHGISR